MTPYNWKEKTVITVLFIVYISSFFIGQKVLTDPINLIFFMAFSVYAMIPLVFIAMFMEDKIKVVYASILIVTGFVGGFPGSIFWTQLTPINTGKIILFIFLGVELLVSGICIFIHHKGLDEMREELAI